MRSTGITPRPRRTSSSAAEVELVSAMMLGIMSFTAASESKRRRHR
tara:strand:- start:661 stop:798 length:138 start_codon:yes stop_codon:yes gene_type:complete